MAEWIELPVTLALIGIQQLHFQPNSLPMARERGRGWPKCLGPWTHVGELDKTAAFDLTRPWLMSAAGE